MNDNFFDDINPQGNKPITRRNVTYRIINGKKVMIQSERPIFDPATGTNVNEIIEDNSEDDGRGLYVSFADKIGKSWTGKPLTAGDTTIECLNPYGDHEDGRLCHVPQDGKRTELGTPLCSVCFDKNENRKFWYYWLSWIWNPELY
jgi:hypothetical protein